VGCTDEKSAQYYLEKQTDSQASRYDIEICMLGYSQENTATAIQPPAEKHSQNKIHNITHGVGAYILRIGQSDRMGGRNGKVQARRMADISLGITAASGPA